MTLRLTYTDSVKAGCVRMPGSKSIAARALIMSSIYGERVQVEGLPDCDDTNELASAIDKFNRRAADYNLGTGGTSLRFFLALAASTPGFEGKIDCSEALRNRPLRPLIEALRMAGAEIAGIRPPLTVRGKKLSADGVKVSPGVSSQFISALMMASTLWTGEFIAETEKEVSRPYIEMTRRIITEFADISKTAGAVFDIEGDWSAASFFYELALLTPGRPIRIVGLQPPDTSLQGDSACVRLFGDIGVSTEFCNDGSLIIEGIEWKIGINRNRETELTVDASDTPDLVPPLAVGMCMAGIKFRFIGIGHLRHKESDRISTLVTELEKAGFVLESGWDFLAWSGVRNKMSRLPVFDSHGDHRIGMAMTMTVPAFGEILLSGAEAVGKSFSNFFETISDCGIYSSKLSHDS